MVFGAWHQQPTGVCWDNVVVDVVVNDMAIDGRDSTGINVSG